MLSSGRDAFEAIAAGVDYPMYIATTAADGERAGCLVGFATQCSIDPPRFLACISDKNRTYRVLDAAAALAIHLPSPGDDGLVELFGSRTGDAVEKFARCAWTPGPDGLPILDRCPRWFAGRILERIRLGDHVAFVLDPYAGASDGSGGFYPFSRARELEPGHEA